MNTNQITMLHPIPILRIFDEKKALEFYVDFLEFKVDWTHRFEENTPIYMQLSSGKCLLHLSEHYGDASPGSSIRIMVDDIRKLHEKLISKQYKYARPGVEETPWNTLEIKVGDPFFNRIIFYENKSE
ncbi:glyoxalase superfamily protein [Lederbergia wuyishanensis]|uniref:Bleomycin resistance protein n=1 Tax=Lederbergia wuyishanensis TaxID=1347903 RepID=A0ABU0D0K0_9BACI|nr:glyoxalase superfamily protein [Lederbergia wuyishanensis]MCJ8006545.1 VOC family protein [Lederbergia wuyishanensis]MDQ0341924.1 putative glyoxalase superfamily protein PhnB [Lederbergia wuyishanensis]